MYTAGDIFKVVDEKSSFLSMGYKAAADAFKASREKSKSNYKVGKNCKRGLINRDLILNKSFQDGISLLLI